MKIDQPVMTVLSTVECSGNRAVIVDQLDRKLYTKVNEVLVALGGKWNRSAKAHVFEGDAATRIDEAIIQGEVATHKDIGFFPTPPSLARQLIADLKIDPGMTFLEPSAGTGRIVDAALAAGAKVTVIERDATMRKALIANYANVSVAPYDDFLDCVVPQFALFDRVGMNPAFLKCGKGDHLDHVRRAFEALKAGGQLKSIMPVSIEFRQDRRHREFREWVLDLGGEIERLPDGSFRESGTNVNTCTVFLEKR